MHLGTLLARLRREDDAALAIAALDDLSLVAEIAATGVPPAAYVADAASRFASEARHEDWLHLLTLLSRPGDAGTILLREVVRWALAADRRLSNSALAPAGCSCGG